MIDVTQNRQSVRFVRLWYQFSHWHQASIRQKRDGRSALLVQFQGRDRTADPHPRLVGTQPGGNTVCLRHPLNMPRTRVTKDATPLMAIRQLLVKSNG
ncbi:hypothetical protein BH11ARM2_BH11ARM2_09790 [soil metagenome]